MCADATCRVPAGASACRREVSVVAVEGEPQLALCARRRREMQPGNDFLSQKLRPWSCKIKNLLEDKIEDPPVFNKENDGTLLPRREAGQNLRPPGLK